MISEEYARMRVSDVLLIHMNNRPLREVGAISISDHIAYTQLYGMKRRSGGWAVEHAFLVRGMALQDQLEVEVICASTLHDVIEDTNYTLDQIRNGFEEYSGRIAFLVEALTKRTDQTEEEYFDQIVAATMIDPDTIFIKLYDRLDGQEWRYDAEDSPDYLERACSYYKETLGEFAEMCARCRGYVPDHRLIRFDELVSKIMELASQHLAELEAEITLD